jgi:hypothetical protein
MNSPREYLKFKYSAPSECCKCGNCQLVPPDVLARWAQEQEAMAKALEKIAAMDPKGIRADDLGRAARIASEAAPGAVGDANAK